MVSIGRWPVFQPRIWLLWKCFHCHVGHLSIWYLRLKLILVLLVHLGYDVPQDIDFLILLCQFIILLFSITLLTFWTHRHATLLVHFMNLLTFFLATKGLLYLSLHYLFHSLRWNIGADLLQLSLSRWGWLSFPHFLGVLLATNLSMGIFDQYIWFIHIFFLHLKLFIFFVFIVLVWGIILVDHLAIRLILIDIICIDYLHILVAYKLIVLDRTTTLLDWAMIFSGRIVFDLLWHGTTVGFITSLFTLSNGSR